VSNLELDHNILCFWQIRETSVCKRQKLTISYRGTVREAKVICPFCASDATKVVDKREGVDGKTTRRRRECIKCGRRFTTFERVETLDLLIVKKDGKREAFDRSKLRSGIIKSCEKRPVAAEDIERVIDEIEAELRKNSGDEVSSKKVGELVIKKLRKLDEIAYIRFASVYRQFADIGDFEKELIKLSKGIKRQSKPVVN